MTDTYDRLQESMIAIDSKELIFIILEAETLFSWNSTNN